MSARPPAAVRGALAARPSTTAPDDLPAGLVPLGPTAGGDVLALVPPPTTPRPLALVLALHGAGGDGRGALAPLAAAAEAHGVLVVAPTSVGPTWDRVLGAFGPDVARIDAALAHVFARAPVDPARVTIEGFSDGASYALSLGLVNGDLFGRVVAFSPGFAAPGRPHGRPAVLVTHGVADAVLPIDRCSRRLVPALEAEGYEVDFREFAGGHVVPPEFAEAAMAWAAGRPLPPRTPVL